MHFEWALDTVHGADYSAAGTRTRKNSGGLLVHKSSHYSTRQLVVDDVLSRVYVASGGLQVRRRVERRRPRARAAPGRGWHRHDRGPVRADLYQR